MRRSKSRSSSLDLLATNSFDFSSHRSSVYTDRHVPIPLLRMEPRTIWVRNFAGIAMRPFVSIVCSYSPRNIVTAVYSLAASSSGGPFVGRHDRCSPAPCVPFRAFPHPPTSSENPPLFPTSPHHIIPFSARLTEGSYPPIFTNTVD